MRNFLIARLLAFALLFLPVARALSQEPAAGLRDHVARFLDHYAQGDQAAVLAEVTPDVIVFGSDVAERTVGREQLAAMIQNDQLLWHGAARIGSLRDWSVVKRGDISTVFFQADFRIADGPAIPLRVSMVWLRDHGVWRLAMSSNVVPTVHQSARELLAPRPN